jgi:hypothetical protein
MDMLRKQIYLSKQEDEILKRIAKKDGVSLSAIIRKALDVYIKKYSDMPDNNKLSKLVGLYDSGFSNGSTNHDEEIYG